MYALITLFYLLFCSCIIYPPTEFVSAGFTIAQLLEGFLGSENSDFITHHMKRICATLIVHSCLPLGYVITLLMYGWEPEDNIMTHFFLTICLTIPLLAIYKVYNWSRDGYRTHPVARNLMVYANRGDWLAVAASINEEFKRVDKIIISMNAVSKMIATNAWIIKTSLYTVYFAHQSDSTLVAVSTDSHELMQQADGSGQYVKLEVKPERNGAKQFFIRVKTADFRELQEKVRRPITILPNVTFQASVLDRFITVFKSHVENNPLYSFDQELDICIGCMTTMSNVKICKCCVDPPLPALPCTECHCKPMWCVDCMARWWASRQDKDSPGTWLQAKCTCPLCRAVFCMLDVSFIRTPAHDNQ